MPNKNYVRGRNKEYAIVKKYRDMGYDIVQRTAGSHSPIDVIAIHSIRRTIRLIQVKPNSMSKDNKELLLIKHGELNGLFDVEFSVE